MPWPVWPWVVPAIAGTTHGPTTSQSDTTAVGTSSGGESADDQVGEVEDGTAGGETADDQPGAGQGVEDGTADGEIADDGTPAPAVTSAP
ncbi:hypothetical protein B5808_19535 (plasmid) [Cnuibacter physcomitrellae]|uniref:Uncharacterized protein n=1 Tax=Cnuibacter physcomitrellae TaxID=1619308 RepID=A0A1X9LR35_9MICO|nr:hypothetical protein B5808_19535 [Cnuibacter physcomitrellae]